MNESNIGEAGSPRLSFLPTRRNEKDMKRTGKSVGLQFHLDSTGTVREAVRFGGKTMFMSYDGAGFRFCDSITDGELEVSPIQLCLMPYLIAQNDLLTPSLEIGQLYADLYAFISNYYVHRYPIVVKFLTLYFIASHVLLRSPGIIHVWVVGKSRSGKTTLQHLGKRFGYRTLGGVNPSEASVYRILGHIQEYAPMVMAAEYDMASNFMRQICREGDIPGTTVPRCVEENGVQVVHNNFIYGSRLNASNNTHGEARDMERDHVIHATKGKANRPRSELWLDPAAMEMVRQLRARLLMWKLANFAKLEIPGKDLKEEIPEGRDWEHYAVIVTLAGLVDPNLETEIRAYIKETLEVMSEDAEEGKTGVLVSALSAMLDQKHQVSGQGTRYRTTFSEIWDAIAKEAMPFIENGATVENKVVLGNGEVLSKSKAGGILKDELGGKRDSWYQERNGAQVKVKGYVWTSDAAKEITESGPGTGRTNRTGFSGKGDAKEPQEQPQIAKQDENPASNLDASGQRGVLPVLPVPLRDSSEEVH